MCTGVRFGTSSDRTDVDYVDYGTAEVRTVDGIARIDNNGGSVNLAFWAWRTTRLHGRTERRREVILNVVVDNESVGPMLELLVQQFPALEVTDEPRVFSS
jgi:hypothetical protein